ncbi:MmcQ/YjbR family DNA-binding protein [Dactylosporangium sp. NPDC005572]|uniref:MmcQ/YjbR family DNA-binding protein n=1 Tax=Dactylosporangium sp. NPDC005572 TaxID=3156889 RepID=UPI0033BD5912
MPDLVDRVREICLAFPGVTEKLSHGTPLWSARKGFVQIWPDGHHDNDFPHLWCAAPPGAQESLVERDPRRYFRPPYVGHRGWVGVRLDGEPDWDDVEELCELAYRTVTPAARSRPTVGGQPSS